MDDRMEETTWRVVSCRGAADEAVEVDGGHDLTDIDATCTFMKVMYPDLQAQSPRGRR